MEKSKVFVGTSSVNASIAAGRVTKRVLDFDDIEQQGIPLKRQAMIGGLGTAAGVALGYGADIVQEAVGGFQNMITSAVGHAVQHMAHGVAGQVRGNFPFIPPTAEFAAGQAVGAVGAAFMAALQRGEIREAMVHGVRRFYIARTGQFVNPPRELMP